MENIDKVNGCQPPVVKLGFITEDEAEVKRGPTHTGESKLSVCIYEKEEQTLTAELELDASQQLRPVSFVMFVHWLSEGL